MATDSTLGAYLNFVGRLPEFFRRPTVTVDEAKRRVAREMDERAERFVDLVRRAVFEYPASPYLPLLRAAGCEAGDVESSVRSNGVEATLRALRSSGVYVTFEEFKGRTPIVRDGRVVDATPASFDNPLLSDGFVRSTGGSTGRAVPIRTSLADVEERCVTSALIYAAHGVLGAPMALWRELPSGVGIALQDSRLGQPQERWFLPPAQALKYRAFWAPVVAASRLARNPLPWPRVAAQPEADTVARWAHRRASQAGRSVVRTGPSQALRAATAAAAAGLPLDGVVFTGAGEPPTPAKVAGIEASGARWVPTYTAMETGKIGLGCAKRVDGSDVHFMHHHTALITHPRTVPGADIDVESFHFTSLRAGAPKFLLNVELDDYGVVEERSCGCALGEIGWTTHLREIFSFTKLTGEGVTFVGSQMVRIVDEVLPRTYGGSPLDYQFVEDEDERGYTRLTLVVSPDVGLGTDDDVVGTVLKELGDDRLAAAVRTTWARAGTLRVRREQPEQTERGKVFPLVRRGARRGPS